MNYQIFVLFTLKIVMGDLSYEDSRELCTKKCLCDLSHDNETLTINCENRGIQKILANWPKHPNTLKATFKNNTIKTLLPVPGSDAKDITLIFSYCEIKYVSTGLLENAINVKYLDLSHNNIEYEQLSADVFKGPYNNTVYEPIGLEFLDLSYNQFHSLKKNLFIHTPNLRHLNLEGNSLRVIDQASRLALSKVSQMQYLNLANNRLTEIPYDAIKHYPNLTEINLSHNELDFVPESLGYIAESLQILNISNNPIIEFEHSTFEGLKHILKLFVNNLNELTDIRAKAFSPLKHLQLLQLTHCSKLSEIDENAFHGVTTLNEVYLNDNNLKTLSEKLLLWDRLEVLNIDNNNFVCDCSLYNITKQHPKFLKLDATTPSCINPINSLSTEITLLTNETCLTSKLMFTKDAQKYGNFRVMRITLTTLIIVLIISTTIASWLGYAKWKTYRRTLRYSFTSAVVYNPISTDINKF